MCRLIPLILPTMLWPSRQPPVRTMTRLLDRLLLPSNLPMTSVQQLLQLDHHLGPSNIHTIRIVYYHQDGPRPLIHTMDAFITTNVHLARLRGRIRRLIRKTIIILITTQERFHLPCPCLLLLFLTRHPIIQDSSTPTIQHTPTTIPGGPGRAPTITNVRPSLP